MRDQYGRDIHYLRISVTDRCNLRCAYCMPEGIKQLPHGEILRYEEILRICRQAVKLGICHFKVTGGEPLVRRGILDFLRELKAMDGAETVTLTTNGLLLSEAAGELAAMNIDGVNISLDTADREDYAAITGRDAFETVDRAIREVVRLGIPTKCNCVLLSGGENRILPVAEYARRLPVDVRFIELMPIGAGEKGGGTPGGGAGLGAVSGDGGTLKGRSLRHRHPRPLFFPGGGEEQRGGGAGGGDGGTLRVDFKVSLRNCRPGFPASVVADPQGAAAPAFPKTPGNRPGAGDAAVPVTAGRLAMEKRKRMSVFARTGPVGVLSVFCAENGVPDVAMASSGRRVLREGK